MKTKRAANAGISNIWVALLLPVFVGFVGLAIDVGYMVWVAQQLQIGADAGALAGVRELREERHDSPFNRTRQAALETSGANVAGGELISLFENQENNADGDIVVGRYTRPQDGETEGVFTPYVEGSSTSPNAIKVVARRTDESLNGALDLFFGPALGINTANLSRSAIGMFGGGTGEGLLVLNREEPNSFILSGTTGLNIRDGNLQVNSNATGSLRKDVAAVFDGTQEGQVNLGEGAINIVGDYLDRTGGVEPPPNTGVEPLDDPLLEAFRAYFSSLDPNGLDPIDENDPRKLKQLKKTLRQRIDEYLKIDELEEYPKYDGEDELNPGYYPDGINVGDQDSVTLMPGIYVLDGDGFYINAGANVLAEGVLLYVVGEGNINIGADTNVTLTPYDDPDSPFGGMSVFQAYENDNDSTIGGGADTDLKGEFYFPCAKLKTTGNNDFVLGDRAIVDRIDLDGTATVTIQYEGREVAIGAETFLVR